MSRCSYTIAILLALASVSKAGLFITSPYAGVSCHGGSPCTVTWADDGNVPLLSAIGSCNFALYQGPDSLVQQLAASLDVSQTLELTFTPNPAAGSDSSDYFIQVTSNSAKSENDTSQPYTAFSGAFTLDNMSGSANDPVASLTSSLSSTSSQAATGSQSTSFSTNGVVSTTTLPDTATTGSASTLTSAFSAISSVASGSVSSPSLSSVSSISSLRSSSGTASAAESTSSTSRGNGASTLARHALMQLSVPLVGLSFAFLW